MKYYVVHKGTPLTRFRVLNNLTAEKQTIVSTKQCVYEESEVSVNINGGTVSFYLPDIVRMFVKGSWSYFVVLEKDVVIVEK
jgi:hypothetical protein